MIASLIMMPVIGLSDVHSTSAEALIGGGYAASEQIEGAGYMAQIYDASNGLPTSDANVVLATSDGYIYIGGYSGIIRYDGTSFERLDSSQGLTSGRALLEDSRGRLWVGTNDNGVVVLDGDKVKRYTYEDNLPSSSIRTFAEAGDGVVYIGSTGGISYVDETGKLFNIEDERLHDTIIGRLVADSNGRVYGSTKDGDIFRVENGEIIQFYTSKELGCETISTIYPDPEKEGNVYLGTEGRIVYHGIFGAPASALTTIGVTPADNVYYITSACGRIWLTSENRTGYIDENYKFHPLSRVPMDNSLDMLTSDYQGNLWFASSRQGVMKIVMNNFQDLTRQSGAGSDAVNSTCMHNGMLYVGTDSGLYIYISYARCL